MKLENLQIAVPAQTKASPSMFLGGKQITVATQVWELSVIEVSLFISSPKGNMSSKISSMKTRQFGWLMKNLLTILALLILASSQLNSLSLSSLAALLLYYFRPRSYFL